MEHLEIELDEIRWALDNEGDLLNPRGTFIDTSDLQLSMQVAGQQEEIQLVRRADGTYEVEKGHRRVIAARQLGWKTIQATILDHDQVDYIRLVAGNVRQDFKPTEKGKALNALIHTYSLSLERAAAVMGIKRKEEARLFIDLLSAPEQVQRRVDKGEISLSTWRELRDKPQATLERVAALPKPTRRKVRAVMREERGLGSDTAHLTAMADLLSQADHEAVLLLRQARQALREETLRDEDWAQIATILEDIHDLVRFKRGERR